MKIKRLLCSAMLLLIMAAFIILGRCSKYKNDDTNALLCGSRHNGVSSVEIFEDGSCVIEGETCKWELTETSSEKITAEAVPQNDIGITYRLEYFLNPDNAEIKDMLAVYAVYKNGNELLSGGLYGKTPPANNSENTAEQLMGVWTNGKDEIRINSDGSLKADGITYSWQTYAVTDSTIWTCTDDADKEYKLTMCFDDTDSKLKMKLVREIPGKGIKFEQESYTKTDISVYENIKDTVCGEWESPKNDIPSIKINRDETCEIGGRTFVWKVAQTTEEEICLSTIQESDNISYDIVVYIAPGNENIKGKAEMFKINEKGEKKSGGYLYEKNY